MWQAIADTQERYLAIGAVAIACGAISPARFIFYSATQKKRLALWQVCLCALSLAIAGGVIGAICGALWVDPEDVVTSAGKAGLIAVLLDPMNIPSTLRFAQVAMRLLASFPIPDPNASQNGDKGERSDSSGT